MSQPKETEPTLNGFCQMLAMNIEMLAKTAQNELPNEGAGPLFITGYVQACKDVAGLMRQVGAGMTEMVEQVAEGITK